MSVALRLTVMTPDRVLLGVDDATKVRVKLADDAWLSIYPYHAPLIAEVLAGPVHYDTETESGELAIATGILQVEAGKVTILTSGYQRSSIAEGARSAVDDRRFERLARQLLMALQAQPAEATGEDVD